jgi:hypothetical protein
VAFVDMVDEDCCEELLHGYLILVVEETLYHFCINPLLPISRVYGNRLKNVCMVLF